MTTIEKIEKKGYKVTIAMSGNTVFARKGNITIDAKNVTQLLKKIS